MQQSENRTIEQISEQENSMLVSNDMDEVSVFNSGGILKVKKSYKNFKDEKTVQYKETQNLSLKTDENLIAIENTSSFKTDEDIINVATMNNTSMDLIPVGPGETVVLGNEAEFHIKLTAKASSPQYKKKISNDFHLPSTPLLNMLYKFVAGMNDIVQVMRVKILNCESEVLDVLYS